MEPIVVVHDTVSGHAVAANQTLNAATTPPNPEKQRAKVVEFIAKQ